MYTLKNNIEDKVIGQYNELEFIHHMRKIAVENDDEELSITCIGEAIDYLNNYCDNLEVVTDNDGFDVISPDGFEIDPFDTYPTFAAAIEAFNEWKKRFEIQGYYSSMNYGKIPLNELQDYCKIIAV